MKQMKFANKALKALPPVAGTLLRYAPQSPLARRYVPIMKTKQIIVGTTLLIFSPEKFSEYATNAGIEQELRDNKQLREAHPDGKAPPEVVAEWKKHNLDRANAIRNSFISSLLITFSSIIIGIAIGAV